MYLISAGHGKDDGSTWKLEDGLRKSTLSFHHLVMGTKLRSPGLGGKCLYSQSHLAGPAKILKQIPDSK